MNSKENKFKVGDKVKFAYDSRHGGHVDRVDSVFGVWLYDIESDSGYIHRRVPETAIELWEIEESSASNISIVKNADGSYNIENLSDKELRGLRDVLLENDTEYHLGEEIYDFYEYIKDK